MANEPYRVDVIGNHRDQYVSIAGESLLSADETTWDLYLHRIGIENVRAVFAGEELAGGLAIYRTAHWFGGCAVDSAGVSGVAVHPAHRGSGACAFLMRALLRQLYDEGVPLSSLYASTQRLYRQCGYAQAGTQTQYSVALNELTSAGLLPDRDVPIHRYVSPSDPPPLASLRYADEVRARESNGLLQRTDGLWQRLLEPYDSRGSITYLIGDRDCPEGYVILRPGVREHGVPQPLIATDVAANTPRALARLVALLYDHRSMQGSFQWCGSPVDPIVLFSNRSIVDVKQQLRWLLRIVHLQEAITQRGYPQSISGEVHLAVHDALIDENSGNWVIAFDQGRAEIRPGGTPVMQLEIDWLAPIFSSYLTPRELMRIGKLSTSGDGKEADEQLERLTTAFSGPSPWLPELF